MTCYALNIMEDPDRDAYRDPDLKDIIGLMPRFHCAACQPLQPLLASEALRCLDVAAPCWKPPGTTCPDGPPATGPGQGPAPIPPTGS